MNTDKKCGRPDTPSSELRICISGFASLSLVSTLRSLTVTALNGIGVGCPLPAFHTDGFLGDVGSGGLDVDGVEGLAGGHEQAVAFGAAETYIGAGLGKADHADALSGRSDHLHAGSCAGPDIAVYVAADSVGGGGG